MTIDQLNIDAARSYYRHQIERAAHFRAELEAVERGSGMYDHYHGMLACCNAAANAIENTARRLGLFTEICKEGISHD